MNVTYDYYRIFYYVCRYGSFTKAAEVLNNSQPNITRAMNNLESQLGTTLFVRSKKGVTMTAEGESLYRRIKIAFEQINMAEGEIEERKKGSSGLVTIGVSEIAMHEVLLPVLAGFQKEHPEIIIRITNETAPSAIRSLMDGSVDFSLVTTPIHDSAAYTCESICSFTEYAVSARGYLHNKQINSLADLAEESLVMSAEGTGTRAHFDALFADRGLLLNPQMTAVTVDQVLAMVKNGLGIGFVPECMITEDIDVIDITEALPKREICLLLAEDRTLCAAAGLLISYIREWV